MSDVNLSDDVILANLGPAFAACDNLGMDDIEFEQLDELLSDQPICDSGDVSTFLPTTEMNSNYDNVNYNNTGSFRRNLDSSSDMDLKTDFTPRQSAQLYSAAATQIHGQNNFVSGINPHENRSWMPPMQSSGGVPVLSGRDTMNSYGGPGRYRSQLDVMDLPIGPPHSQHQNRQSMQQQQQLMFQQQQLLAQQLQIPMSSQHIQIPISSQQIPIPMSSSDILNAPDCHMSSCSRVPVCDMSATAPYTDAYSQYHTSDAPLNACVRQRNQRVSATFAAGPYAQAVPTTAHNNIQQPNANHNGPMGRQHSMLGREQTIVGGPDSQSDGEWTDAALDLENLNYAMLENLLEQMVQPEAEIENQNVSVSCSQSKLHRDPSATCVGPSSVDIRKCNFPDTPPESGGSEPYSPPEQSGYNDNYGSNNDDKPIHISNRRVMEKAIPPNSQFQRRQNERLQGNMATIECETLPTSNLVNEKSEKPASGKPPRSNNPQKHSGVGYTASDSNLSCAPARTGAPLEKSDSTLNHRRKKRKLSISSTNMLTPKSLNDMNSQLSVCSSTAAIKPEPAVMISDCDDDDMLGGMYDASADVGACQVIKWTNHSASQWSRLCDASGKDIAITAFHVDADKGFNFSSHDDVFVCQKKNHFQITVQVSFGAEPKCVRDDQGVRKIEGLYVHFYGIKSESPSQHIKIEQSQADRTRKTLPPYRIEITEDLTAKVIVGRLHFSETTTNNMRKRGRPNPDQRYFQLVVGLFAHHSKGCPDSLITAHASDKIIVRASNPGQFDSDPDSPWTKGRTPDTIFHCGSVGINTDNPEEALTVHGNIRLTGHVVAPSDIRAKTDIRELDSSEQLKNISQLKVYQYQFKPEFAKYAGLDPSQVHDTGVLAQEVSIVLPDAVKQVGNVHLSDGQTIENLLVVNKDRIFIENIGAVKELCKVTDKLETRITYIEAMNKKLSNTNWGSFKSTCSTVSSKSTTSSTATPQHHHHRHHHHRDAASHQSKDKQDEKKSFCSNRFVQITIVVLVLIMALCVTAVTSIYLVDRYIGTPSKLPNSSSANETGSNTGQNASESVTSAVTTYKPVNDSGGEPIVGVGIPQIINLPECLLHDCPKICCIYTDDDYSYTDSSLPSGDGNVGMMDDGVQKETPVREASPSTAGMNTNLSESHLGTVLKEFVNFSSASSLEAGQTLGFQQTTLSNRNNENTGDKQSANATKTAAEVTTNSNLQHIVKRASEDLPIARIFLVEPNVTLTAAYCVDEPCRSETGNNFTYSVLLASSFPLASLTVEFIFPTGFLIICSEQIDFNCISADVDQKLNIHQINSTIFKLPVGYSSGLTYKFRIAIRPNTLVCDNSALELGKDFSEYTLIFHRIRC